MLKTQNKPYFDDFDELKGFLKVLFKPGLAVQTRELNQLQSILQNQLGILANTIFKEGSPIKDGAINITSDANYAKFIDIYNGNIVNYNNYNNRLVYGKTTGIIGRVINGFNKDDYYPTTMYFSYLSSGTNQEKTFQENEVIRRDCEIYITNKSGDFQINEIITGQTTGSSAKIVDIDNNLLTIIYLSDTIFTENEQIVGQTTSNSATYLSGEEEIFEAQIDSINNIEEPIGTGVIANVNAGIYYVDGYFAQVEPQSIIVSKYNSYASSKIGFNKEIRFITCYDDSSLFDNANGEPNENAPGADRLKIELKLGSYGLFEPTPTTFIEIVRLENSIESFNNSLSSQWSSIMDVLAKRTFDESGSYVVNPFILDIREFLDDGTNNGIYKETQFGYRTAIEAKNASIEVFNSDAPGTSHIYQNKYYPLSTHDEFLSACEDRIAIGIEPGKGYILGYEVELPNKIYVPSLKARDETTTNNSLTSIKYGNYCLINNVKYLPDTYHYETVELCSSDSYSSANIVGTAKVRMIQYESGTIGQTTAVYRLYLTDIKMNEGKYFASDVSAIFNVGNVSSKFSCKTVKENSRVNLYDIDKNLLVYPLKQDYVSGLSDNSYYVSIKSNGTIQNNGVLTISCPNGTYFYSTNAKDYIVAIENTTGQASDNFGKIVNISAVSFDSSMTQLTINLGDDYKNLDYSILYKVYKPDVDPKTATLMTNGSYIEATSTNNFTTITTNVCAGVRLLGVYDSEDPDVIPTESSKNITSNFVFHDGQTESLYGFIYLTRLPNTAEPTGQVLVKFEYFSHSAGDFLSVDSYNMPIEEIPTFNGYKLANCIDIRPRLDDIATISAPRIMVSDTFFSTDVTYYQPRIDVLELDYLGNFKVKNGTPSDNPLVPSTDINAMCLYQLELPPYTENIYDIVLNSKQNRRYTMYEINLLERRIAALETYILYTQNDYNAENITILNDDNTPMINVGYMADNFKDHSYGDLTSPMYKCAIDITSNTLRPSYKLNVVNLEKDLTVTSTVLEMNGKYMIPKTDVNIVSQTVGTSSIRMNSSGLINWMGNLLITPSYNNNYNNINQQQMNYSGNTDYINEYNAVLQNEENTLDYNQALLKWLGVN